MHVWDPSRVAVRVHHSIQQHEYVHAYGYACIHRAVYIRIADLYAYSSMSICRYGMRSVYIPVCVYTQYVYSRGSPPAPDTTTYVSSLQLYMCPHAPQMYDIRYIDVLILVYTCADAAMCADTCMLCMGRLELILLCSPIIDTTMLCIGRLGEVGGRIPVCLHFTCLYVYSCVLCVCV